MIGFDFNLIDLFSLTIEIISDAAPNDSHPASITTSLLVFLTELNTGQFFWNVVVSIGGVDYTSRIPGEIVANNIYKLRISIDSSRFARVYINDVR